MSARDRELEYIMSLKDDATAAYKKFVGEFEKGSVSMQGMAKTAGIALAGMFSVGAAIDFMKKAADADAGVQSLTVALRNAGMTGEYYTNQLIDQADTLKKKTATDDDEIINLQKLVLSYTQNIDATKKLVPIILDVSRATGMSSDAAAKLFSRSIEGAEGLKKLGITVGDTANEQERLARIVDEVTKKFGGQAEAFAKTDAGKIASASIAWDDLEKSLGRLLNNDLIPIVPILANTANGMADVANEISKMNKGNGMATWGDTMVMAMYKFLGADDALNAKLVELGENQAIWNEHLEMTAKKVPPPAAATKTFQEKLKGLQDQLQTLDPASVKYLETATKIEAMQNKVALATERAKLAAKGAAGTTLLDLNFSKGFAGELQIMKADASKFFVDFKKESDKMFGGSISADETKRIQDQADLIQDLRVKSYGEGKQKELAILNDWETNAIAMAHDREDLITQITETAAAERAKIESEYSMQTFQSVAGYAQQAIGLYQQMISQNSQAATQMLEKQRSIELKGIDKESAALKKKYDALLDNENLTAEEKDKLRKQQQVDEENILKRKEQIETEYDQRIGAEKARAFNANKTAQMIASIINTAVEVTKVLATPWMIPIVAGLGAAQVALIASQPTPSFHTGGAGYFDAAPSQEAMVKIRGGERIDVYTPEQRDASSERGITIINHFNVPIDNAQWVADAIMQRLKQTGLPIEEVYADKSANVVLA